MPILSTDSRREYGRIRRELKLPDLLTPQTMARIIAHYGGHNKMPERKSERSVELVDRYHDVGRHFVLAHLSARLGLTPPERRILYGIFPRQSQFFAVDHAKRAASVERLREGGVERAEQIYRDIAAQAEELLDAHAAALGARDPYNDMFANTLSELIITRKTFGSLNELEEYWRQAARR